MYLRVFEGKIAKGDTLEFAATERAFTALEVGTFSPKPTPSGALEVGTIGYVVTGIKEPGLARVGDTLRGKGSKTLPLPGYAEPKPVVWARSIRRVRMIFLNLGKHFRACGSPTPPFRLRRSPPVCWGRGFRCGFLGMLHLEIVTERLRREFGLTLVVTTPTITYEVETKDGKRHTVYSPSLFPEHGLVASVQESLVDAEIILPAQYLGSVLPLLYEHEGVVHSTTDFSEGRIMIKTTMPLRELMRNFFDKVKSITQGYASISYEITQMHTADVARLDVMVADELVPAFSRIVASSRAYEEAKAAVEKLYAILLPAAICLQITRCLHWDVFFLRERFLL